MMNELVASFLSGMCGAFSKHHKTVVGDSGGVNLQDVLLVLDHAPDYRETFLRVLGRSMRLTVVAQPCDLEGLAPPPQRKGYEYIELHPVEFAGFVWQPELHDVLSGFRWDVVCVALNIRHLSRMRSFYLLPHLHGRWIWWGHVFGRTQSRVLDRIRKGLLSRSAGCLTYNEPIARLVKEKYGVNAVSFNNSEVLVEEFRTGHYGTHSELRFLFVGRFQERKRLERLVQLAEKWPDVRVRLIGPGMKQLSIPDELLSAGRVQRFGRLRGAELDEHFDWADLVVNPGHVGLLVMNSARHGKGIAIDADSLHAPEYWLAHEARQPFVSFGNKIAVETFLDDLRRNRGLSRQWGQSLQEVARKRYTVEHMAQVHVDAFNKIL